MTTISVIVPVYRVEQYLPACVDSILGQTFRDFELILVDDGSPDRCGAMCDAYAAQDPRVRVIHQQNGGLSAARNAGIEIAGGDYLTFIDSDDYVPAQFLSILYKALIDYGADISICQITVFLDGKIPAKPGQMENSVHILSGKEAVIALYRGNALVPVNACGKLFSTQLVSKMRFPIGRLHEDQAYVPIACYRANTVVCVNSGMYFYRERPESITTTRFSLKRYDDIWAIDQCIDFFETESATDVLLVAREKRKRAICVYSCLSRGAGISPPEKYAIRTGKALRYLRKHVSEEKYAYCLEQVNPWLLRPHAYWVKLKSLLRH